MFTERWDNNKLNTNTYEKFEFMSVAEVEINNVKWRVIGEYWKLDYFVLLFFFPFVV